MNSYMDDLVEQYILFGAGELGIKAMKYLGRERVLCLCSNESIDERKKKQKKYSIDVISPDDIVQIISRSVDMKVRVVVSVYNQIYENQIIDQLSNMQIEYILIRDLLNEFVENDLIEYEKLNKRPSFRYKEDNRFVITSDLLEEAGGIGSYFWQDLWAAKHIFNNRPKSGIHYDIGSRVDGFVSHLLAMDLIVRNIDIRPLDTKVPNMEFCQSDATNLDQIDDESVESISALCSLEHFGLGRYGDPIDPEACFKCFASIQRVTRPGGSVYISVPIGEEKLMFNAQRSFYAQTIIDCFDSMELIEFCSCSDGAHVDDFYVESDIHRYDSLEGIPRFGMFMFMKK